MTKLEERMLKVIKAITYEEAYDKALEMEVDIMAIVQDYAT